MKVLKLLREEIEFETGIDLVRQSRKRENVYTRAIYFRIAKDLTNASLASIGRTVKRDHATVIHGLKIFDNIITVYEEDLMELYKKINLKYNKKEVGRYNDPLDHFREQIHDLEEKYESVVTEYKKKYESVATEYKKVVTNNAFMKAVLKRKGYNYQFLKEEAKTLEEM